MRRGLNCIMITLAIAVLAVSVLFPTTAKAAGHYMPGVMNIRDFVLPPPGFYLVTYNAFYFKPKLKNSNGNTVNSVNVGGRTVNVDADATIYGLAPAFIFTIDTGLWGINYGAVVTPSFGNTSITATLETEERGISGKRSQFNVGDLYVQPLWFGKHWKHVDLGFSYGFYAPIGKYSVGAADNIGLGFWSHQMQLASYFYPWEHKATAIELATTFEINQKQRGTNFTPGDILTVELGLSHYVTPRLELGASWYSLFEVTDDKNNPALILVGRDQVHAAGAQVSYWVVKDRLNLSARYMGEFLGKSRLQGHLVAFNITWVIHPMGHKKE